jgi:hypothetical protein
VKEFEDPEVVAEFDEWGDVGVDEADVGAVNDGAEFVGGEVGGEEVEEFVGEVGVGELGPAREERADVGEVGGEEETAVGREAGGDGGGEPDGFALAARGEVLHGGRAKT